MIVYQLTTHFPLCGSKTYLNTIEEAKDRLALIVEETERYRKCQSKEEREALGIVSKTVTRIELDSSCRLIKIDISLLQRDIEDIFGASQPINEPWRPQAES